MFCTLSFSTLSKYLAKQLHFCPMFRAGTCFLVARLTQLWPLSVFTFDTGFYSRLWPTCSLPGNLCTFPLIHTRSGIRFPLKSHKNVQIYRAISAAKDIQASPSLLGKALVTGRAAACKHHVVEPCSVIGRSMREAPHTMVWDCSERWFLVPMYRPYDGQAGSGHHHSATTAVIKSTFIIQLTFLITRICSCLAYKFLVSLKDRSNSVVQYYHFSLPIKCIGYWLKN